MGEHSNIIADLDGMERLMGDSDKSPRQQEASQPLRVDGHVDIPYHLMSPGNPTLFRDMRTGPFTPDKAMASGVRLFGTALYCQDGFNGKAAMGHLRDLLSFTRRCFSSDEILRSPTDLDRLKDNRQGLGTVLLLENADALGENPGHMATLVEEGIRIIGLTHAGKNRLADGNGVAYPDGLTKDGEEVIRALVDHGLIIDAAHLHPTCFWQVAGRYDGCLIDSHTGARKLYNTTRNLDMDQAKEIHDRKGVIGITFNPEMLSPERECSLDDIFAHMDTFVQCMGPETVGIGSDFLGFERPVRGMEEISQLPNLAEIMANHGYDESSIQAILGGNWIRLYEGILAKP